MLRIACALLGGLLWTGATLAQTLDTLSVAAIMRDARWIGPQPDNLRWGDDGRLYFDWNPGGAHDDDSLYVYDPAAAGEPTPVPPAVRRTIPSFRGDYDADHTRKVYVKEGDLWLLDLGTQTQRKLTDTWEEERSPAFLADGRRVAFLREGQPYV
ncbi:MAG: S9 family peptidase, partial [Catalinimonas sp.]